MLSKTSSTLVLTAVTLAAGAWAQDCLPASVFPTYSATTSVTIGEGTRASIIFPTSQPQDITVTSCGEATVGPSAKATIQGGRVVLSGTFLEQAFTISNAIGYAVGTNVIPTATYATVSVAASGSLAVQSADYLVMDLGPSATVSASGSRLNIDANSADSVVTATAIGGQFGMNGPNVAADITYQGGVGGMVYAGSPGGRIRLRGELYTAIPYDGAQVSAYGSNVVCEAYETGTCTAFGPMQTHTVHSSGYAEVVMGTQNLLFVEATGSAIIGGEQNTAYVSSLGTLEMRDRAAAVIESGGVATLSESISDVTISSGGTATLYRSAIITAAPGAQLRALSPQTTFASIGMEDQCTIFQAREVGPSVARRADMPLPTGRCSTGSQSCPNLRGVFSCVNTQTDLFNCGGCALSSDAGVDCTQLYDGDVQCIAGRCVPT